MIEKVDILLSSFHGYKKDLKHYLQTSEIGL
jgi:hypothetical protein